MEFTKSLLAYIFVYISIISSINAQNNKISIRTNAGIAGSSELLDGYYYSFDIGIPLSRYFEISPTFTGASMTPKTFASFHWQSNIGDISYGGPLNGPIKENIHGDIYNSIGLVLYLKLLKLILKNTSSKQELLLGFGFSYESYTRTDATYIIGFNDYELIWFNHKLVTGFGPIYGKISYNYYFKENAFYGLVVSLNDFDVDGEYSSLNIS